jgi:hypothetical protein
MVLTLGGISYDRIVLEGIPWDGINTRRYHMMVLILGGISQDGTSRIG